MGELTTDHRPLMAGVAIKPSSAPPGLGPGNQASYGTLTAVARRNTPNKERVLVTNLHVVSNKGTSDYYALDGNESVYQFDVSAANKVGTIYVANGKNSWLSADPKDTTTTVADLAALQVENAGKPGEIQTSLGVHVHDTSDAHEFRPIVQPVKKPENGLNLTYIGATSGSGEVTVLDASADWDYDAQGVDEAGNPILVPFEYKNVVYIDRTKHPGTLGDSGAPLLWEDPDGNFHLCCINFGSAFDDEDKRDPKYSYAIPASVAEREFGITFGIRAPRAVSTNPGRVRPGQKFQLDGSGSKRGELDAEITGYKWEELFGDVDDQGDFSSTTYRNFSAPSSEGDYKYKLTVRDTNLAMHSTTVTVKVTTNTPPVAQVEKPKTARKGSTVELDGTESHDPDGGNLKYQWEFMGDQNELERLGLVIKDSDQAEARFTAPGEEIALPFRLTVTDDKGDSDTADVTVNVKNHNPIAIAGRNQLANLNKQVTLKGSVSDLDPADRKYVADNLEWTQCADNPTQVTLATVAGWPARRTFTPTVAGEYFLTLIATDPQGLKAESKVKVKVLTAKNRPPIVKAGPDQEVTTGSRVELDGSGSKLDTSGEEIVSIAGFGGFPGLPNFGLPSLLTFEWIPPKGVTLSSKSSAKPHFTAPNKASTLVFTLKVTDFYKLWAYDDVTITVCTPWADTSKPHKKTVSEWKDTGQQRENQLLLIMEKEQTRTITTEKEQKRNVGDDGTEYRWVSAAKAKTETRWVPVSATPPPSTPKPPPTTPTPPPTNPDPWLPWADVNPPETRNKVTGLWADTGNQRENPVTRVTEKEQTRTITWEKRQERTSQTGNRSESRWVSATKTETRWVSVAPPPPPPPPPPVTHSYRDITPAVYSGCGPTRKRKQECVRLGHEDTNWRDASEPLRWGPVENDGSPTTVTTNWENKGSPSLIGGVCKQLQRRTITTTQKKRQKNHCGGYRPATSVVTKTIKSRYVTVSETWGSWRDTGKMRENQILLIIEKEQERFSSPCNRRQTRWVYHSDVG